MDKVSGKEDLKVWTEVEEVRGGYCTSRIGCADLRRILYRSKKEDTRESFAFFFFSSSSVPPCVATHNVATQQGVGRGVG